MFIASGYVVPIVPIQISFVKKVFPVVYVKKVDEWVLFANFPKIRPNLSPDRSLPIYLSSLIVIVGIFVIIITFYHRLG